METQCSRTEHFRCWNAVSGNEWPWIQGRVQILNDTGKACYIELFYYTRTGMDDSSSISFMFMICAMVDQVFFLNPYDHPPPCHSMPLHARHQHAPVFPVRVTSATGDWRLSGLFPLVCSVRSGSVCVPADQGKAAELLGQCHETENFPCHLKPCRIYNQAKNILPHYLATAPTYFSTIPLNVWPT